MNIEQKNKIKRIAIWTITESGFKHGVSLAKNVDDSILFLSKSLSKKLPGLKKLDNSFSKNPAVFTKLSEKVKELFHEFDGHIFIFSTGIAIRIIAPLLESKIKDPAVVV
ncbi:MAG: hypothetical protein GY707_01200, partial [Desulfobacteraceae bacterium]|nr:hypothetical protein [Desulfobacteraceae bacterium]